MNFGFNALNLFAGEKKRGVAHYTAHLVRALAGLDMPHLLNLYVRADYDELDDLESARLRLRRIEIPSRPRGVQFVSRIATEQLQLVDIADRDGIDLLHCPDHVAIVVRQAHCPIVLTIHDLTTLSHPKTHSARARFYMQALMPASIRRAARIVCVSHSTELELHRYFEDAESKTTVVHSAASGRFRLIEPYKVTGVLRRWKLASDSYLLYLGTIESRKNLEGLIRAYARACILPDSPVLAIAGRVRDSARHLLELPRTLGIEGKVHFLGYVDDDEAVALYNGALAFIYPSLYEGFGLPILEAMACGTPVITSNTSSMPEVAGDAAILVDPGDPQSLANAIVAVATQPELRTAMRNMGLARSSQFSWDRCARETVAVWEQVVSAAHQKKDKS